jgi:hypothetical protein
MEPHSPNTTTITTHEKATKINLDRRFYGTFAEIGAGQEVARWFFVVGGASGTLAKTISARASGTSARRGCTTCSITSWRC